MAERTVFERAGGTRFFEALVERFYAGVASDRVLLALYPSPDDLTPARRRLAMFLSQYWGGPSAYSEERGHPRLRLRHAPFAIGPSERDRWLHHMRLALEEVGSPDDVREELWRYFEIAAEALRNRAA